MNSHGADIWLCPVHAGLAAYGAATCRLCAERGGVVRVRVYRIAAEPIRLPMSKSSTLAVAGPEGSSGPRTASNGRRNQLRPGNGRFRPDRR